MRLEPCERRGQGAGKMSYNVVTQEGVRTFENIDDAGDYAQAMSFEDWRAGQGVPCRDRTRRIHRPPNHEGHEMRINFNSKDGVFAIKAENEEEKTQLKTSAVAICNLIIDFFDGEVQEMKAAKE